MSGPRASSRVSVFLAESLVGAFAWGVTRLFYPLRVRALENLPRRGGALLVSNHVSYADWLLLTAAAKRPVRFLIAKEFYDSPWLKPFVRVARVIPIPSAIRPHEVARALRRCGDAIRDGEVVCVFAEGGITRSGNLMPFRPGFEKIMRGLDAPIVLVALDGVWGSIFSFEGGKFFRKWPRKIRRPVTVSFGPPLPSKATSERVRAAVAELSIGSSHPNPQQQETAHRRSEH
ncbi:MAG: 1-acyl-sn-glycerol-3-phosphate acyltransferase [Verrucomicrobiota bacterium]|nr:1-acyl-sn-glycerol-3-phosphate acyltransferase [Verrucomicrobiota bacterium]